MAQIVLEGMRFYAYHGVHREERLIGGDYIVDVYITTKFSKAAVDDDLQHTINYQTVYQLCEGVMRHPSRLLENVVERIGLALKHQFKNISALQVRVRKLNPPLGGPAAFAAVESEGEFTRRCADCGRPMICYGDKTCWCMDSLVFRKTREFMRTKYGDQCLCSACLQHYAS
ncbi:MAG: dihydroneopterin aldolase [Bacteroidetes bacterium]|nr:MAG: dihydroneopterin aldolase [Bacteroidota bacterium]